jgi:hypothetical protein
MVVQNNPTPWVVFALFATIVCGVLGLMLGLDPFGPGQEVRAEAARTQLGMSVLMTENAIRVSATPQAVIAQQTIDAGQLTAMPVQQTITQVAGQQLLEGARINATQTAVAGEMLIGQIAAQATQTSLAENLYGNQLAAYATWTAIAEGHAREQAAGVSGLGIVILGALVFSAWLVTRLAVQVSAARAQEKAAHAQLLAEQRRLLSLRASIQNHKELRDQRYPIPTSLMRKSNNGQDLPRAE